METFFFHMQQVLSYIGQLFDFRRVPDLFKKDVALAQKLFSLLEEV